LPALCIKYNKFWTSAAVQNTKTNVPVRFHLKIKYPRIESPGLAGYASSALDSYSEATVSVITHTIASIVDADLIVYPSGKAPFHLFKNRSHQAIKIPFWAVVPAGFLHHASGA